MDRCRSPHFLFSSVWLVRRQYEPDTDILVRGMKEAKRGITLHRDPLDAVKDADVIYTDVWTSMGQEAEKEERTKIFQSVSGQ